MHFDYKIRYPSKDLISAGILSRKSVAATEKEERFEKELISQAVGVVRSISASSQMMSPMKARQGSSIGLKLWEYIFHGWPKIRNVFSETLAAYLQNPGSLSFENGLI